MNERIRELAEQANKQIRHRICPNTFKPIDDPNGPHIRIEFDKEEFAESIVQEMLKLLEQYSRDSFPEDIMDDFDNAYLAGLRNAREAVKKHFGVEE